MGQTLTHGVYLPNEGERNCYSGLASNWRLLDGAIGTIAAHTTAIAGKADISHAHGNISNDGKVGTTANVPLITGTDGVVQAGSFGNAANTFCEGNDSRLSDARTPVAHTHTKSDVTDLLNSNFIPSANNSYDLGSSSYQWNNLYAKNYYYNGVAWGLDKGNTWTGNNTFTGRTSYVGIYDKFQTTAFDVRTDPESTRGGDVFRFWSGTGSTYGDYLGGMSFYQSADGSLTLQLICFGYPQTGNSAQNRINFHSARDGTSDFYPVKNNNINLGTSTSKWKTLNGINPGALSLPDYSSNKVEPINFGQWSVSGGVNDYTPDIDGWLGINIIDAATNSIFVYTKSGIPTNDQAYCASVYGNGSQGLKRLGLMIPVRAGITYGIIIKASSVNDIDFARLYPCLGNV